MKLPRRSQTKLPHSVVDRKFPAMNAKEFPWAVVDFETLNEHPASAWEVSVLVHDREPTLHSFFIKPDDKYRARRQWGSSFPGPPLDWNGAARPYEEVFRDLAVLLDGCLVLAHNAVFEKAVFEQMAVVQKIAVPEMKMGCTLQAARACWPGLAPHSLENLCGQLGITNSSPHRSDGDVLATYQLVHLMQKEFGTNSIFSIFAEYSSIFQTDVSAELRPPPDMATGFVPHLQREETTPPPEWFSTISRGGPLEGKRVFISGYPNGIAKRYWREALINAGALISKNPVQRDDYFCTDNIAQGRIKNLNENNKRNRVRGRPLTKKISGDELLDLLYHFQ